MTYKFMLPCGHPPSSGVEYSYPHPEQYDGISEWKCDKCNKRFGRWTLKELKDNEFEPKYGLSRTSLKICHHK